MHRPHSASIGLVCLVAVFATVARADNAPPKRLALLVGVDKYANLPEHERLEGAANDVGLMKQTLVGRFQFTDQEIVTLVDERATGAAIRAALEKLAAVAEMMPKEGPVVPIVFHFSGHGAQVPDQPEGDADRDEADGLDETLVPFDARKQGGPEDIRDDELNRFVHRVCANPRVRLWVVLDCCHSGTGTRGEARFRQLGRTLPKPDKPVMADAGIAPLRKELPANCVVLSACRADEQEPEFQEKGKTYGLMTRFLTQTLQQTKSLSKLTYAQLKQSVEHRYVQEGVLHAPAPQLEGNAAALATPVLGSGPAADREPLWKVERLEDKDDRVRLHAGALQGVTPGGLYEMFPSPEAAAQEENSIAWLRVDSVESLHSEAAVMTWFDAARTRLVAGKLPEGFKQGFARLRQAGAGDAVLRLRVAVHDAATGQDRLVPPGDPAAPPALMSALNTAKQRGERDWFIWLKDANQECDLLLRIDGKHAALFPATGTTPPPPLPGRKSNVPASLRGGWGPIDLSAPTAAAQLKEHLRRVTRARTLLRLAAELERGGPGLEVHVEIGKVDLDEKQFVKKFEPLPTTADSLQLPRGSLYAYRIKNAERRRVFVTILSVSRDMGIEVVFPHRDTGAAHDEHEVPALKERYTDAFEVGGPAGERTILTLVTPEPVDFTYLAQEQLPRIEKGGDKPGQKLSELIAARAFFQANPPKEVRAAGREDDSGQWSVRMLRWYAGN